MATITIRKLENQVVERGKERARRNGRSLEGEFRASLTEAVMQMTREVLEQWTREIAASTPPGRNRIPPHSSARTASASRRSPKSLGRRGGYHHHSGGSPISR